MKHIIQELDVGGVKPVENFVIKKYCRIILNGILWKHKISKENVLKRENLKTFRRDQGLTQDEMANKLGISTSHYKNIEVGTYDPSFKLLTKFGEVFDGLYDDIWDLFKK